MTFVGLLLYCHHKNKKGGIATNIQLFKIEDFLRGRNTTIIIRWDIDDFAELPCAARYDPELSAENGHRVRVPKKIEVFEDNVWKLYPSVSWLDGVEDGEQLVTRVLAKLAGEEALSLMQSPEGVPDGELMEEAKKAGIYTQNFG